MNITDFAHYSTLELIQMRKDIIEKMKIGIEPIIFPTDIDTELEHRASKRTLADDEQPENPILDMGQSFIPKTAY